MTSTGHSVTTARSRSSATRQVSKEHSRCRGRGVRVLRWQRKARRANNSRNSRRGPGRLDRSGRLRQPTAAEGEPPREWFERLYNGRQWTPTRRGRAVNSVPGAAISPNDQPGFSPGHDSEKRVTACPTWAGDRRLLRSHTSRRKPHSDDGPSAPPRRPHALSR